MMIDWDYLFYLHESHPKRYNALVLSSQGFTYNQIKQFLGGNINDLMAQNVKRANCKNKKHLIRVAKKMGII